MRFFKSLVASLYDLSFLKAQKNLAGRAWGYFFVFVWLVSVLVSVRVIYEMPGTFAQMRDMVHNVPDFVATVDESGVLKVDNLPQPYVYETEDKKFMFVVNTVATTTPSAYELAENDLESVVLITNKHFEMYNASNNQSQLRGWKDLSATGSLSKAKLEEVATTFLGWPAVVLASILIFIGVFIGLVVAKLFSLLFASVIAFVINAIAGRGWTFKQVFVVGFYALTLPGLVSVVLGWFSVRVSYLHFIMLLAFILAIIFTKEETVTQPVA